MTYVAVMNVVEDRVGKYASFNDREAAEAHVANHADRWPSAFVAEAPDSPVGEWRIRGSELSVEREKPGVEDYQRAITDHLEAVAKSKQYDGSISLVSYVGSTNPLWAAEAAAFMSWRDEVWVYAYEQLALVGAGQRTAPGVEEFIAELPAIDWPN